MSAGRCRAVPLYLLSCVACWILYWGPQWWQVTLLFWWSSSLQSWEYGSGECVGFNVPLNTLPDDIASNLNVTAHTFKNKLKTFFYRSCYSYTISCDPAPAILPLAADIRRIKSCVLLLLLLLLLLLTVTNKAFIVIRLRPSITTPLVTAG